VQSVIYYIKYAVQAANNEEIANNIKYNFQILEVPKQVPLSGDCGVYVIKFCEMIFKNHAISQDFNPVDALNMRKSLAKIVIDLIPDAAVLRTLPHLNFDHA